MQADGAHARRAGTPAAVHGSGRTRLDKRAWRDVRRATRTLNADGNLYAAEVHGIKIFFRWPLAHQPAVEASAEKEKEKTGKAGNESAANAQRSTQHSPRTPNSRQRRSAKRLQEYMRQWCSHQAENEAQGSDGDQPTSGGERKELSRAADAAGQESQQPPAADDGGEVAEEGCESLKWHFRRHPDGGEQRKLGVAGRVWHVRCACPVDTWPCRHMADEDAMSDVPAADPLPAPVTDAGEEHEEESDADNGDNGSRSPGRARAKKPRGSKSRRKRR